MSRQTLPMLRSPAALARLTADVRGGAAVEFALVSSTAIVTVLGVMFIGLLVFMGQALDRAASVAARQIMTGAVQKQAMTQNTFVTSVVCPALPASFNCGNVIVNVQTVAEAAGPAGYYAFVNSNQTALLTPTLSNAAAQFSPGLQGSYVYLQIVYPMAIVPAVFAKMFGTATYNGAPAYLSVATAAFRNEQY